MKTFRRILYLLFILSNLGMSKEVNETDKLADSYYSSLKDGHAEDIAKQLSAAELKKFRNILGFLYENKAAPPVVFGVLGDDIDLESIKRLDDTTFFTRIMNGWLNKPEVTRPAFRAVVKWRIVGDVDETAELRHVLVQVTSVRLGQNFDEIQVLSYANEKDQWHLIMPTRVRSFINGLRAACGKTDGFYE